MKRDTKILSIFSPIAESARRPKPSEGSQVRKIVFWGVLGLIAVLAFRYLGH